MWFRPPCSRSPLEGNVYHAALSNIITTTVENRCLRDWKGLASEEHDVIKRKLKSILEDFIYAFIRKQALNHDSSGSPWVNVPSHFGHPMFMNDHDVQSTEFKLSEHANHLADALTRLWVHKTQHNSLLLVQHGHITAETILFDGDNVTLKEPDRCALLEEPDKCASVTEYWFADSGGIYEETGETNLVVIKHKAEASADTTMETGGREVKYTPELMTWMKKWWRDVEQAAQINLTPELVENIVGQLVEALQPEWIALFEERDHQMKMVDQFKSELRAQIIPILKPRQRDLSLNAEAANKMENTNSPTSPGSVDKFGHQVPDL